MSEKEKKAIKRIYDVTHNSDGSHVNYIDIDDAVNTKEDLESCETFCKAIDTVLNLIDKHQKEIKNLTQRTNELIDEYEKELLEKNNYIFRLENVTEALHKLIDEEMG